MLQRIQTVFLSTIVLAMCVFLRAPIWQKIDPVTDEKYILKCWALLYSYGNKTFMKKPYYLVMCVLGIVIMCMAIYSVTQFRKRMRQRNVGALNSLLLTILLCMMVYFTKQEEANSWPSIAGEYQLGFFMPLVAMVANLLANHFIKRDEKLVQSTSLIR